MQAHDVAERLVEPPKFPAKVLECLEQLGEFPRVELPLWKASHPSPRSAARLSAARLIPPTRMGGPPDWAGRGSKTRPSGTTISLPSKGRGLPVQHPLRTSIISSVRCPRVRNP